MLRTKAAKTAVVGLILFVVGLAWGTVYEYSEKLKDPPGWIMDRQFYPPATTLAHLGICVFTLGALFGMARWIYGRVHAAISSPRDHT